MAISILDPLVDKAGGIRKTSAWYRNAVSSIADRSSARRLMNQGKLIGRPSIGRLNMFFYDPKYKKTLPYYDTFPLVLPIDVIPGGFVGINFHYLPIPLRMRLLDRIVDFSSNTQFDENTVLNVTYQKVKSIRLVRPTIHKYLAGYTRSQFRRIDADELTVATLLPVQRFKKASADKVWSDSRKMV